MSTHLSHKIAWETIGDLYVHYKTQSPKPRPHSKKQLEHIARVFANTLREFKETDKTSDEEKEPLDARWWSSLGYGLEGIPGYMMGIYSTLVWGYIELNLLLLDPERFASLMMPDGKITPAMKRMLGQTDMGHGDDVADHLRPAFTDRYQPKSLTPDVLDIFHKHTKLLFKCMYLISGENRLLDDDKLIGLFFGFFGWNRY